MLGRLILGTSIHLGVLVIAQARSKFIGRRRTVNCTEADTHGGGAAAGRSMESRGCRYNGTTVAPERGRTVGLFSADVPRELLYALGCAPVRVFPTAAKPTAAEDFLPRNFCALTKLFLASFLEDTEPTLDAMPDSVWPGRRSASAVIFADQDDAARRLYDVWRACVPVPVWGFVEVPRAATPLAASRYAGILARLAADLEAHTGQSLTTGTLRQAIVLYNEQRSLLADLKRCWLAATVNTAAYRRLRRMALTRDPIAANEQLWQVLKEQDKETGRQGEGETGRKGDKGTRKRGDEGMQGFSLSLPFSLSPPPPISLSPCHPRLLLLAELAAPAGLVRLVEAHGARVVAEDSDLDERDLAGSVPAEAKTVEGLLLALARAYLSKPPGPRMRDLPRRLDHLTQLVSARGVQAAICAYSKFCDLYLAEFPILKAHLNGLGVPVLLLELEDEAISGQHRTRVEAFLEMTSSQPSVTSHQ